MNNRVLLFSVCLILSWAADAADKKCELQKAAEIPVTINRLGPIAVGEINGTRVQFVIDSGSFFSFLTLEAAESLQLKLKTNPLGLRDLGSSRSVNSKATTASEFSLVGLGSGKFKDVDFIVVNESYGSNVVGVIGQNIIGAADAEYDLANGVIRLMVSKGCNATPLGYWSTSASSMALEAVDINSPRFVGKAEINGQRVKAMFDSSTPSSVITRRAADKAGFDPKGEGVTEGEMFSKDTMKTTKSWLANFAVLSIGDEQIKNARIRVADVSYENVADMILGMDFLLSHRIYFAKKQKRAYFTYNGGSVFSLAASAESARSSSSADNQQSLSGRNDAAAIRLRGVASLARNEVDAALADFEQAIRLEPGDAENYHQRALAHLRRKNYELAFADFEKALTIKPTDAGILVERGIMRNGTQDFQGASADFDAALRAAPDDGELEMRIARSHYQSDRIAESLFHFDNWIAKHPKHRELAYALNESCWIRVTRTKEFEKALSDCNASIKITRNYRNLDSRGMVWLRLGKYDAAITDYKSALALKPNSEWSLYGLGIAENRVGKKADSDLHIRSALAIDPKVAENYKKLGLEP